MLRTVVFLAVTGLLLAVTIVPLRERRSWAWARFMAFEMNVVLIFLNLDHWIEKPLAARQIISWLLLAASIFVVIHGVRLLKTKGQPNGHFERTTRLVTTGIYQYIRHPMYASLLYLAWGACLKNPTVLHLLAALLGTAFIIATAKIEEKDNLEKFGKEYSEYMTRSKMFVPFVF